MKYKNINSMLHNFGHSFCSLMNYVDGEYIFEVLASTLKQIPGGVLKIHFPSGQFEPLIDRWLPEHIKSHKLEPEKVANVMLTFTGAIQDPDAFQTGFECDVTCSDDKGNAYKVQVVQKIG